MVNHTDDSNMKIKAVLQRIEIECYSAIANEQRLGRAIKEQKLDPYPQKYEFATLAELASSQTSEQPKKDPQVSIEEAVKNAPDKSVPKNDSSEDDARRYRSKLGAYFDAVRQWYYDKKEKEYEYYCAKRQTADRIYGFEYVIDVIHGIIKELELEEQRNND